MNERASVSKADTLGPLEGYETAWFVWERSTGRGVGYVAKEVATNVGVRGGDAMVWVPFDAERQKIHSGPLCHTRSRAIEVVLADYDEPPKGASESPDPPDAMRQEGES